jgi:hypothetical protein
VFEDSLARRFERAGQQPGDQHRQDHPRRARRSAVSSSRGFHAGPTFDFIGERFADFANSCTVDAYQLMGRRAGMSGRRWELFGEVRNLFDTE